jgi:signal transduction histidine kinase/ActR/RegA family two-component response regulator
VTEAATLPDAERLRVVLVDDTDDIRLLVRLALDQAGGFAVVGEAADGVEAVDVVRDTRPDLILLDLSMPRMDGLEALPTLRGLCPAATILVLSGFEDESLAPMARSAGADGYLRKGASPQEIVRRVRQLRGQPAPTTGPGAGPGTGPATVTAASAPNGPRERLRLSPAALRTAPFGLLTIERDDADEWWVTALNETAEEVLAAAGTVLPTRLTVLVEPLEQLVGTRGSDVAPDPVRGQAMVDGRLLDVSLHGHGDELSVVLLPKVSSDDAARLRRAFAATAHEMRNPVTILIGAAEALVRGRDSLAPEVRDRLFDAIARQARLLGRSTADLMAAAQQDRDSLTVSVERVVLRPELRACADAQPDAGVVDVDCAADLTVVADLGRLEQMVANLVSNAVKYGEPPVAIAAHADDDAVRIDVSDAGAGVADEFVPHLFDEFSRESRRGAHGTGLGLYVVRSLAQAQGGSASYARVGGRSVFTLVLPSGRREVEGR